MGVFWRESRGRWSFQFRLGRKRHTGYCVEEDGTPCGSRRAAERAEERARIAAEAVRRRPSAPLPTVGYTLAQAFSAYAGTLDARKSNYENQLAYIAELRTFFSDEAQLAAIDEAWMLKYVTWAREQPMRVYVGGPKSASATRRRQPWKTTDRLRTDTTITKYLVTLRATLKLAHRTRDVHRRRLLADLPEVPSLKAPKRLPRPIADADVTELLRKAAPHVADAAALSLLLGLRRAEAYGLTVAQVDLQHEGVWLDAEGTKGNRDEFLPANADAMRLLRRLVEQAKGRGTDHLITWRQMRKEKPGEPPREDPWRPVKSPKTAIRTALKKAGLAGRHRFHDLKGTYTTGLAHVAPGRVVQQLSRHKSFATTEMYIRVADQATRAAVDALAGRPAVADIDLSAPMGEATAKATAKPKRRRAG
ncbi:MAG: tyrosine-type recombinase/integrase [Alphaproteobacteria bacterium]